LLSVAAPLSPDVRGAAGSAGAPLNKAREILLVDDHADTAKALARVLQEYGHTVHTVGTCADAMRVFRSHPGIGVALLDLSLPDCDGCQLLRDLQSVRHVPGIAISAYGMAEDLARTKAAGFIAHVVKPMVLPRLKEILANMKQVGGDGAPAGDVSR
jgi:CheY-like chemotaxis protein